MDVCDAHLVTQVRIARRSCARAGRGRDFTAIDSEAVAMRGHQLSKPPARGTGVN
jgi:hypothetical protein